MSEGVDNRMSGNPSHPWVESDSGMPRCVACGSQETEPVETWQGYRLRRCRVCGLTFTENPRYRVNDYQALYRGEEEAAPLPEAWQFVYQAPVRALANEALAWWVPTPWLSAAERAALAWLRKHAPPGSRLLDIGCGAGRFLRAARKAGFDAVGMEVDPSLVALLRRAGLPAFVGALPDAWTWQGPPPWAVTLFEVLEHFPDPAPPIAALRERFPQAVVLASVPSPFRPERVLWNERYPYDYPPNHYLRWTPEALRRFFRRMGYPRVEVLLPPPLGSEHTRIQLALMRWFARLQSGPLPSAERLPQHPGVGLRAWATVSALATKGMEVALNFVLAPWAWWAARQGASALSMLTIAYPSPGP